MVTVTLRETTAERLQRLAKARGLTVEETIEELVEQSPIARLPDQRGLLALEGMLTEPVIDASETDEEVVHQYFEEMNGHTD